MMLPLTSHQPKSLDVESRTLKVVVFNAGVRHYDFGLLTKATQGVAL